ncbi:heme oxygenase [Plasmodium sp. gorilla clade G3]|nr:heme oxygenase [Plasmodium sp. gorilla clade G3]
MIRKIIILMFTFFSNIHNEKIYHHKQRRKFVKGPSGYLNRNIIQRKHYNLYAKKFINYKEIQIQRINDYRKRSGVDKNNINYNLRDTYNYHETHLFVRNEVLPTLAKIENENIKEKEKNKEIFRNINDYNSNFTRQTFLQFLMDLYNIFLKIDDLFLENKTYFSILIYNGPMQLTNHLYDDIIYVSSVVENSDDVSPSEYCMEYISHLENLCEENKLSFLAHAYVFYKNFHLSKEHLLKSICKYLNIIKKLKSSTYVADVENFEFCLNKMSRKWSRWEKDNFLASLHNATNKMMILTKHFEKVKS